MSIEIRNISKNFGNFKALGDVSLDIESGELVALLGPSGWRPLTTAAFTSVAKTPPKCMCASGRWGLCFSTTRCSAT